MGRGRPRGKLSSPLSILLIIILREAPADTSTLSFYLGIPSKKLAQYLNVLRRIGYVERDGVFWRLSDKGLLYITKLGDTIRRAGALAERISLVKSFEGVNKIVYSKHLETIDLTKENQRNSKENQRNSKEITNRDKSLADLEPVIKYFKAASVSSLNNIISIVEERLGRELTEVEHAIISFLVEKSRQLQRRYLWPPSPGTSLPEWLASETGYPSHLVSDALRELESHGIVFLTIDRRRGVVKIRLDRSLGAGVY